MLNDNRNNILCSDNRMLKMSKYVAQIKKLK